MTTAVYINAFSVVSPLGRDTAETTEHLFAGRQNGLLSTWQLSDNRHVPVGRVPVDLSSEPREGFSTTSANNRLLLRCFGAIENDFRAISDRLPNERVGIVLGTSTSGMREAEIAFNAWHRTHNWPDTYDFSCQELGDPASVLAAYLGVTGPSYTVSTACTSSAKAIMSGARLISAGLSDVVICGGADTVCGLTMNGFAALEALSAQICNPFSRNRAGITLGEGAALFVLSQVPDELRLAGWGETSDAYNISAPHPQGLGAEMAVRNALGHASLEPQDVGYINLHGTGTDLNDSVEAGVIDRVFGRETPCSSTKSLTGHMLGAAGACEVSFVALSLLSGGLLPPHVWDGEHDPQLPRIALADGLNQYSQSRYMMSCSYAFGGNNAVILVGKE